MLAEHFNSDPGFFEHVSCRSVGISFFYNYTFDISVDKHLCAQDTRLIRAVKSAARYRYAEIRRLDDCILLSVDSSAKLMPFT